MSMSLAEAKQSLKAMFPALDDDAIQDILQQTNGNVEQAVESLLSIFSEAGAEPQALQAPGRDAGDSQAWSSSAAPPKVKQEDGRHVQFSPDCARQNRFSDETETFPPPSDDFLTLARYMKSSGQNSDEQCLEDEALARRLQDSLYLQGVEEMARRQDGASQRREAGPPATSGRSAPPQGTSDMSFENLFGFKTEDLKKKIGTMGVTAKSKMNQFMSKLQGKEMTPVQTSPPPSLSYRPIESDYDDTTVLTSQTADQNISKRAGAHTLEDDDEQDHGLVDKRSHAMAARQSGTITGEGKDKKVD